MKEEHILDITWVYWIHWVYDAEQIPTTLYTLGVSTYTSKQLNTILLKLILISILIKI